MLQWAAEAGQKHRSKRNQWEMVHLSTLTVGGIAADTRLNATQTAVLRLNVCGVAHFIDGFRLFQPGKKITSAAGYNDATERGLRRGGNGTLRIQGCIPDDFDD